MEEHDRMEDANKLLVQTLELVIIGIGLIVLHCLGVPLLMPMLIGLVLFFPCAIVMRGVQHRYDPSSQ